MNLIYIIPVNGFVVSFDLNRCGPGAKDRLQGLRADHNIDIEDVEFFWRGALIENSTQNPPVSSSVFYSQRTGWKCSPSFMWNATIALVENSAMPAEMKVRHVTSDFPSIWDLFAYALPSQVRERVYCHAVEDLKEDYLEARREYDTKWARRWLTCCWTLRTAKLWADCLRVAGWGRTTVWIARLLSILGFGTVTSWIIRAFRQD